MNFLAYIGFSFIFICFILSFYIALLIIDRENNAIIYKSLSISKDNSAISIRKAIFILIWNNIIFFCSSLGVVDFFVEIIIISKSSKYLSEGNNINDKNILYELFRIPKIEKINDKNEKSLNLDNFNIKNNQEKFTKLKLFISDNNKEKKGSIFDNGNNKFREIEIIQKIEYKSTSVQTEENNNISDDYIFNSDNNLIDEDLSNNFIFVKEKSLINSKTSL